MESLQFDEQSLKKIEEEFQLDEPSLTVDQRLFLDEFVEIIGKSVPLSHQELKGFAVQGLKKWEKLHGKQFSDIKTLQFSEKMNILTEVSVIITEMMGKHLVKPEEKKNLEKSIKTALEYYKLKNRPMKKISNFTLGIYIVIYLLLIIFSLWASFTFSSYLYNPYPRLIPYWPYYGLFIPS